METWPDVGKRIALLMREKGYWNPKRDKPDVLRFSMDYRYVPAFLYKWLTDGVVPSRENLDRLAKDFGVSAAWILFGDEVNKAPIPPHKRGGRKLGCLVAALGLWWGTAGTVPAELGTLSAVGDGADSDNSTRGILSTRRRGIWRATCQFLSVIAGGVSPTWPVNALGIARS